MADFDPFALVQDTQEEEAVATDNFDPFALVQEDVQQEEVVTDEFDPFALVGGEGDAPSEPVKESDAWEQFSYAFDKQDNLTTLASDILESYFPLGNLDFSFAEGFNYIAPEERYGEDFMKATPEERRDIIAQTRLAALEEEYGADFVQDEDSAAKTLGEFAGAVADPTSLLPVGATIKVAAPVMGAMGGAYSVMQDVAANEDIDVGKAAMYAGGSAAAGAAFMGAAKGVGVLANKMSDRGAKKLVEKAQDIINQPTPEGIAPTDIAGKLSAAGMDAKQIMRVEAAYERLGTKPRLRMANTAEEVFDQEVLRNSAVARSKSSTVDHYFGLMSTRIKQIDERTFGKMREFEFDLKVNTSKYLTKAESFTKELNKVAAPVRNKIGFYLSNGEFKAAQKLMNEQSPELVSQFKMLKTDVLDELGVSLQEAGHKFDMMENFFPRIVNDKVNLWASLGKQERAPIDNAIAEYAKRKQISVQAVPEKVKDEIANQVLRGHGTYLDGYKPGSTKQRTIQRVSPEQYSQYYADPAEALHKYISSAVNDIELRKFFGRTGAADDIEESIGKYVREANLSPQQEIELRDMLTARFVGGNQTPKDFVKAIRDLGYIGTIANPFTAIKQLADLAVSAKYNGFKNTIATMFKADGKEVRLIDLGLDNTTIHDIVADSGKLSNTLRTLLQNTGFNLTDRLGKETYINAALKKARAMARSDKGISKLREKWGEAYGDIEFNSLIKDIQSGQVTPRVKFHLFNELSDVQPITLLETPEAFAANPNGRIAYMLKLFTLKQYDIVRNNIIKEWKQGNKKEAVTSAAILGGYLATANLATQTIVDILLGRDVKPEDIPSKSLWALLGIYGFSNYSVDRYLGRGDLKGFAVNTLTPATPIIDAAFQGTQIPFEEDPNYGKVVKGVPVVGNFVYNWFLGGAEKFNERQE